jgi:phosphohistidine phosphatase SixA
MAKVKITLLTWIILTTSFFPQTAFANDLRIWDQLQGSNPKGYVLLIRHALAPGSGDPVNFKVNDCSTQRNLSEQGRVEAKEIGEWLARREVKIFRVESSRWCRAKETAQILDIGKVVLNKNLDSLLGESDLPNHKQTVNIKKRIVNHRNTSGLLVFVGHFVNFQAAVGASLDSGEGVLVKANAKGEIKIVGSSPKP